MLPDVERVRKRAPSILAGYPEVAYALVFGSVARGEAHARSDLDLAVGGDLRGLRRLELEHELEVALDVPVQVVVLEEAPPALRFRAFRDGVLLSERDHDRRIGDQIRAVQEYLDYRHLERRCVEGVLKARSGGARGVG